VNAPHPAPVAAAELVIEGVRAVDLAARFGTPCYVYSRAALEAAWRAFDTALAGRPHLICYAMKANSNLAVLDVFARLGSGFDIVSGGELERVIAAGGDPHKVVFSGVGKRADEIRLALDAGILCFNIESRSELALVAQVARDAGTRAPVSLRVNPDVDPKTHPYISTGMKESKFGVAFAEARALYRDAASSPSLRVVGIDCHIGSQITEVDPFVDATRRMLGLVDDLARDGIAIEHIDVGGGLGIRYTDEAPPPTADYLGALLDCFGDRPQTLVFEPGRALVGNAGLLLTRVDVVKHGEARNFAIVDAAMNDLLRPSLYDATHRIEPVVPRADVPTHRYEVVGPVCESGDFLGRDRALAIAEGDLLAIRSAGAYGMSMASNYNTRPRAAEVMVDGTTAHLVRRRETVAELFAHESRLPAA
jgi:diaminopimelate decarboxylase